MHDSESSFIDSEMFHKSILYFKLSDEIFRILMKNSRDISSIVASYRWRHDGEISRSQYL